MDRHAPSKSDEAFDLLSSPAYQALIESFDQAIWQTDAQGKVRKDSLSWRAYTGQSLEEWMQENWMAAVHPDEQAYAQRQWQQSIQAGIPLEMELRLRRPDSSWRWSNVKTRAIRNADGSIRAWIGISVDISAYRADKDAQQTHLEGQIAQRTDQLRASQELLRATLNSSPDQIEVFKAVRDEQNQIIDFQWILLNEAADKVCGEVLGKSLVTQRPDLLATGIFASMIAVVQTGLPYQQEIRPEPSHWFFLSLAKQDDGIILTTRDITSSKEAEQELQQARQLHDAVFRTVRHAITVFEAVRDESGKIVDFRFIFSNGVADRYMGVSTQGKTLRTITPSYLDESNFTTMVEVVETNLPTDKILHFTYGTRPMYLRTQYMKLQDGLVMVYENITERQIAEAKLLRLKDEVAQKATDKYLTLFNHMEQGFCIIQVLFDESENPVDYLFLEVNPVFERQTGLRNATGKKMRELQPLLEEHWFQSYGEVVKTGKAVHFENEAAYLVGGVWYEVFALPFGPPGDCQVAVLFNDITLRRRNQQRQEHLLKLSDALRPLANPNELKRVATDLLEKRLEVTHVFYREHLPKQTELRSADRFGISDESELSVWFQSQDSEAFLTRLLGSGNPVIIPEITTATELSLAEQKAFIRAGIAALVLFPLLKNGHWVASLWIHQREPREWNLLDVSLIEETVERTWVAIERARTEEALRESEARYRSLLQNLPDYAIYRMDSAGIITEWNEGAQRMKGYSAQEMIGKHASICYTPEAVAAGQPAKDLREAAQTGRVERESIRIRKSGERFWVNEIATAIHDTHGQLTGFTKISRDITRRKRGQALQLQLEQRTRLAVEAAEMATWEWHLATDKVYWNEQHFKLLGMTIETSPQPSEAFTRHLHPQDRTWVLAELQRAIDEQSLFDVEFRIIREDGVVRWMSGYGRVTGEEEGQPTQMSGAMLDITDRKQAEEEIRKSEERLQRVLSISTVGVIYFDLEGGIHKVNEAFQRMSGYPVEAFALGQVRWDTLTAPEFTQYTQIAVQEYRRKGENTPYEKQYIRPDGSRWWGLFAGKQLSEGEFVEFVLDITETKRAGEILKQADRKKDDFLAMLAHELRNPMATLRNGLQILSMTGTSPSQTRGVISMMSRQTEHLVRMVDDLLDVSRISRGKIELHQETVNLVELVRQSVESVTLLYEQKQQQLHVSLPKHPIEIEGDATRLVQVVTNLLTNAARYTGETGVVDLQLEHQSQEAILRIRDNGIGLASDQLTAIFELFVQVDNSLARSQGGLGLGLTLVKQIVELHGGQVEAQSEGLNQGSTFTVHLPTLTRGLASEASQTDTFPASEPLQILVVDDNLDATLTLSMLLELKGYQVHTRNSGRLALEAAEQLRPDVILLDIGMPDLDGYETCRHLRQQPWSQQMFIVAVSGYGLIEDKQKAKEVGFDEHLTKPLDLDALIHLLNTYQS